MHIDGSIRINPSEAIIDASTVLFAVAADEDALSDVCKFKHSSVSSWITQFQMNRKEGGHAARQRAKHIKMQSPVALARVFAASANPNFSTQHRLQTSSLLNVSQHQYPTEQVLNERDSFREPSLVRKFNGDIDLMPTPTSPNRRLDDEDVDDEDGDEESSDRFPSPTKNHSSTKPPPMLSSRGHHAPISQRLYHNNAPMTAQERRASFSSSNVKLLMQSTKKELMEKLKRESQPDSNLERLMNVVEQGGHTVLLMMMDDDLKDLEVSLSSSIH